MQTYTFNLLHMQSYNSYTKCPKNFSWL